MKLYNFILLSTVLAMPKNLARPVQATVAAAPPAPTFALANISYLALPSQTTKITRSGH